MLGRKKPVLDLEGLYNYAVRLLSGRALSSGEVREKLRQRAADAADVDGVIARLKDYKFLDDTRFAEGFAAARRDNQGLGQFRVTQDLRKRRVAPALAEKASADAYSEVDETAQARQFIERKYRAKDLPTFLAVEKNMASAYRRLRTAGFSSGIAIRVLKDFTRSAEALESLENEEPIE